jgi:hypothetical protein
MATSCGFDSRRPHQVLAALNPSDRMTIPAYLINLDRSPDRLAEMQARLDALGVTFIRVAAARRSASMSPERS